MSHLNYNLCVTKNQ